MLLLEARQRVTARTQLPSWFHFASCAEALLTYMGKKYMCNALLSIQQQNTSKYATAVILHRTLTDIEYAISPAISSAPQRHK